MAETLTRRSFSRDALSTLLTYSLLDTLGNNDLFADKIKPVTRKWLTQVNDLGLAVKKQKLKQVVWQKQVEELFGKVELSDLLKMLDFDRLTKGLKYVDNGALSIRFKFPRIEGLPTEYVFGKQVFALKRKRSVVPHGHNNMATAFLILEGKLRGRHYDRLEDRKDEFLIRPTIDRKFRRGEHSSISDYKDNIHWFEAQSDRAFIFNIHVLDVTPGSKKPTGRVYLDPNGKKQKGGLILARKVGYKEVHKLYG
ncbi:MAG: hypothetical protein CMJ65_13065 [Planctomycetaceae bacterium]|nr:hypothetical protein [Planctomycetaceae bacterium]